MRLKLILGEEDKKIKVERDYRKYFISLIKNAFARSGIFTELYSQKKVKPFTFSVFLGDDFLIPDEDEKEKIEIKPPFKFLFSTGDPVIFSHFYNGILEMKKNYKGLNLPGGKIFPVKDIILSKNVKIRTSLCIFRTVGVCVLTDPEQNAKDFEKWFVVPDEKNMDRFNKILEERMIQKYERIKGERLDTKIKFTPLSEKEIPLFIRQGKLNPSFGEKPVKEVYVKHYNGYLRGFKGVFFLESHPEMLQFIYDYGLGVRTGQGFGLLEVIAQI